MPVQKQKEISPEKSDSEDFSFHSSSSDDEMLADIVASEKENLRDVECLIENDNINNGDFVLTKVPGKKNVSYYVAEIINCEDNTNELKYLRRIGDSNRFLNDATETFDFFREDILFKLPAPCNVRGTARHAAALQFPVDFSTYNVK